MLEHFERLQLAHYLCQRIAERHQDEILIGAVYGSTARAADTPWSDLEMWFVMQDGCQRGDLHLLYRDAAVSCFFHERSALEESVSQPSTRWPFYMGVLSELQVLYGDPALVQGWIEMGTSIPPQQFITALEAALPDLVVESHGRLHTSLERQDKGTLFPHVFEVLFEMLTALCLLNQRWVTRDYYPGLEQSFEFPKLPVGYREIVPVLYETRDPGQTVELADRLVDCYWDLLRRQGVRVRNYQNLGELPI